MPFLIEAEPHRGMPGEMPGGALRLVARNPGRMTNHGTNTYIVAGENGWWVLDPGPRDDAEHVADILHMTDRKVMGWILTHGHHDHYGALDMLRREVPAPLYGFHQPNADAPMPDVPLQDGDRVGPFTAVYTPGHAPDHLCFAWKDAILFTGDHVMGWSSSVVSPPHGDMGGYIASLERLIARDDRLYLPGHGPAIPEPRAYAQELQRRRLQREEEILLAISQGLRTAEALAAKLYLKTDPVLQNAALRNVLSHLGKLSREGKVQESEEGWSATPC